MSNAPASDGAVVTVAPAPSAFKGRTTNDDVVLILPISETSEGIGIYPESSVLIVKRLRAEGVNASFAHPSERRLFEGTKSVATDVISNLVLGILTNATWDGIKLLLTKRRSDSPLQVTFGQVDRADESVRWRQVTGTGPDVLAAIDKLLAHDATKPVEPDHPHDPPPASPEAGKD